MATSFNPVTLLRQWFRNAPFLFMAVMIHIVIIAVMSVMYMGKKGEQKPNLMIMRKARLGTYDGITI